MKKEEIAGNRDTGRLKMIALVCMIIDHVGARIYPEIGELRVIGRIAFPLYIWSTVLPWTVIHDAPPASAAAAISAALS